MTASMTTSRMMLWSILEGLLLRSTKLEIGLLKIGVELIIRGEGVEEARVGICAERSGRCRWGSDVVVLDAGHFENRAYVCRLLRLLVVVVAMS